ncbi:MAG: hypothetical protein IJ093_04310 [Bacilli bacterium]|nr:hypothetical protein [Bacilli bacterium]
MGFDSTKTTAYTATAGIAGGTVPTGSMTYSGSTCQTSYKTNASLSATFLQPGDKIVYTLTIANKGSLDATIDSITVDNVVKTSNFTTTKGNIKFTVTMPASNSLAASTGTTTMTVTAEFQNTTNLSSYTTSESQSINIGISASQNSGGSGGGETGFTGTLYSVSTDTISVGDSVTMTGLWCAVTYFKGEIENNSCEENDIFSSQEECNSEIENWGTPPEGYTTVCKPGEETVNYIYYDEIPPDVYLKHNVVNGIIQSTEACLNGNISICLKPNEYSTSQNNLNTAFGSSKCSLYNDAYICGAGQYYARAYTGGKVNTQNGGCHQTICEVDTNGDAHCYTEQGLC